MKDSICALIVIVGIIFILGAAGASDCGSDANTNGLIIAGLAMMGAGTLGAKL